MASNVLEVKPAKTLADLDALNKKLIAMSPRAHVTDQFVKESYESLCDSIEDWFHKYYGEHQSVADRIKMLTPEWRRDFVKQLLDSDAACEIARIHESCDEEIMMKMVMRYLFDLILRRARWVPGMSAEHSNIFTKVLKNLCNEFPYRGMLFSLSGYRV